MITPKRLGIWSDTRTLFANIAPLTVNLLSMGCYTICRFPDVPLIINQRCLFIFCCVNDLSTEAERFILEHLEHTNIICIVSKEALVRIKHETMEKLKQHECIIFPQNELDQETGLAPEEIPEIFVSSRIGWLFKKLTL